MYILSAAIDLKEAQKDDPAVKIFAKISPMATQNVNLAGMYYYGEGAGINISEIITALTKATDNLLNLKKKEKKLKPKTNDTKPEEEQKHQNSNLEPEVIE